MGRVGDREASKLETPAGKEKDFLESEGVERAVPVQAVAVNAEREERRVSAIVADDGKAIEQGALAQVQAYTEQPQIGGRESDIFLIGGRGCGMKIVEHFAEPFAILKPVPCPSRGGPRRILGKHPSRGLAYETVDFSLQNERSSADPNELDLPGGSHSVDV
jgi:hypothetical protein